MSTEPTAGGNPRHIISSGGDPRRRIPLVIGADSLATSIRPVPSFGDIHQKSFRYIPRGRP